MGKKIVPTLITLGIWLHKRQSDICHYFIKTIPFELCFVNNKKYNKIKIKIKIKEAKNKE